MIRHLLVAHDLTPEADVALARAANWPASTMRGSACCTCTTRGYRRQR
ncbi:hypothetical protein ACP3P8_16245 [Pseudomonas aeruginosa]